MGLLVERHAKSELAGFLRWHDAARRRRASSTLDD